MPRETISGEGFDIGVGWTKDKYVQVAVKIKTPEDGSNPITLKKLVNSTLDDSEFGYGLYSTIENRAQINRLIKILRKARDSAFGADE